MKKIRLSDPDTIKFSDVSEDTPIFVKKFGRLIGMIVKEGTNGWIIRVSRKWGSTGYHDTSEDCMRNNSQYKFYIES